jgi:hypothetical protein
MKLCFKILAIAITAATAYALTGCAAPASFSYQNVSLTITAQCGDCPTIVYNPALPQPPNAGSALMMPNTGQGGVTIFTANVTNAPANITWTLYPTPNLGEPTPPTGTSTPVGESGSQVGTLQVASGNTVYYAQNGVPVYSGAALAQAQAMGIPQGDVLLVASVPSDPNNPSAVATANQLIQIYGGSSAQGPPSVYLTPSTPTVPAGLTNPVATFTHGGAPYQFFGGVVGAAPCASITTCGVDSKGNAIPIGTADNAPIWEVGPAPFSLSTAVVGGDSTYGFISQTGLYTPPATIPVTQPVVILVSHLVPTISKFANIAIN